MKRLLTIVFMLLTAVGFSQENVIKLGLSNIVYGDYSLSYERMINPRNSMTLKVGYFEPTSSFLIEMEDFSSKQFSFYNVSGGLDCSMEYRFYFGKKDAPSGFYVAPYARFGSMKGASTDSVRGKLFVVAENGNVMGVGVQLGYQWIIKDLVSVDFSFFGAGVDRYCAKLKYLNVDPSFTDFDLVKDDVKSYFGDFNYLKKRLDFTTGDNNDYLLAKLPFLFPGFRFSVTVGIAF